MSIIRVRGLGVSFGAHTAVSDVSLDVEGGEIFGILGPNGAGKTTTVECIAGALPPTRGAVDVLGFDPAQSRRDARRRIGYQLQAATLPPALRVGEAIEMFATFYPAPASTTELLSLVGLTEHRRRPFGKLSGGQQQRLSIAIALVGNPEVVIFDELTTGLDPQARRAVWSLVRQVRESGVTVLLVTHALDEVEVLCDRLVVIDDGSVRFLGAPDELIALAGPDPNGARALENAYLRLLDGTLEGGL